MYENVFIDNTFLRFLIFFYFYNVFVRQQLCYWKLSLIAKLLLM